MHGGTPWIYVYFNKGRPLEQLSARGEGGGWAKGGGGGWEGGKLYKLVQEQCAKHHTQRTTPERKILQASKGREDTKK